MYLTNIEARIEENKQIEPMWTPNTNNNNKKTHTNNTTLTFQILLILNSVEKIITASKYIEEQNEKWRRR